MSSKEKTLSSLRRHSGSNQIKLPEITLFSEYEPKNLVDHFCELVKSVGGEVIKREGKSTDAIIKEKFPEAEKVILPDDFSSIENLSSHDLKDTDLVVFQSNLGIAENGAVWLHDKQMTKRILPFIIKHVLIELESTDIVWNMHQAYEKAHPEGGFGVFISGPSKTADIEQHLVIGAHGPEVLTIVLD